MVRREYKVDGKDSIFYDGILSKVYAIQNAANANVYGFNLGLEIKLLAGFVFTTRYNYQVGKEEMDNGIISPSRHAAPAFGISQLTYSKNKFYLQLYAFYSAEVSYLNLNAEEKQKSIIYAKDKNGNPYSPSWYTLNFKAMVQLNKSFLISTGIENITNVRYRPYSSGLVAPGRNFIVSFKLNF
jgi:hemoglobin/transferrin/lactoferrin receptor protein